MSSAAAKKKRKPSIYIDTCIARDVTHRRNNDSIALITRIKQKKWPCSISIFGLMELIDIEQEDMFIRNKLLQYETLDNIISTRKSRNLNGPDFDKCADYIQNFVTKHPFIETVGLDDEGWSLAVAIANDSNLNASDVIHLASAWMADCDVVVTRDDFFISEAKRYLQKEGGWVELRICKPEECYSVLEDMGYEGIA